MDRKPKWPFVPLGVAVLIVSDTRTPETDSSGDFIEPRLKGAGHRVVAHLILKDDRGTACANQRPLGPARRLSFSSITH